MIRRIVIALAAFHLHVAASAPKDPKILDIRDWERVWRLCNRGDPAAAMGACMALLQRGWLTRDAIGVAYTNLAIAYLADGQPDHALVNLDAALKYYPTLSYAYFARARVHSFMGAWQAAADDYTEAIRYQPELLATYINRGDVYRVMDRFDLALADFEQVIAADPNSAAAFAARGNLYRDQSRYDLALADYDTAIALDAEYTPAYNRRCFVHVISGGDLAAALSDCEQALAQAPGNGAVLATRALVHLRSGDLAAAYYDSEAAVAAGPLPEAYLMRGLVRLRYGRDGEGRADLAEAERLKPGIGAEYAAYGVAL
jgi:tetratricopeptide (TPR) repeat protein